MNNIEKKFTLRSKIWIENREGNVVFGLGRLVILDAIDRQGSMNAAAKELKMSYRSVWCRIRESEERLGKPLVIREGKGSVLTPFAKNLISQFRKMETKFNKEADKLFDDIIANSF